MKKLTLSMLLLSVSVLTTSVQAQVINGDLNHNDNLDVEDVTLLIDGYLTGETEDYTPKIDFYQEDNSLISGIWWLTNDSFLMFKEDGTFYGLEYKFFPSQGRVVLLKDGVVSGSFDVVYLTDEVMIRRNSDGSHETLTRTRPKAVDLGLSVKWATMNIGANSPEEYGDYFAWGETTPKDTYSSENYKWYDNTNDLTKYCTSSIFGKSDGKTILDPEDDAAYVNWGGTWRMPTYDELNELQTKCTWTWTTQNGVEGRLVTGPNGNSIFLPAAGYRNGSLLNNAGSIGTYWSSSLFTRNSNAAYCMSFGSSDVNWNSQSSRCVGLSVRAVCP